MNKKTIFDIPDSKFEKVFNDPNGLESPLTTMRRDHPDLARTPDGKGIIIHKQTLPDHIILKKDDFSNLEYLNLAASSCGKITFTGEFPNLEHIDLSKCKLKEIDFNSATFPKLKKLYLRENQLSKLHITAAMPNLELLDAGENPLLQEIHLDTELPALKYLYFYKKKEEKDDKKVNKPITHFSFQSLPSLKVLDLENGGLKKLPENFLTLEGLETLYLSGSRLEGVPDAVIGTGGRNNSARDVFAYLSSNADVYLRQSKLFFIGNGEVGKTSIWRKLKDKKAPLVEKKNRTDTLDTIPFPVKNLSTNETGLEENNIDYHFDIWDFGGQDKYREIQQLFCSPRSLYIYVTSYDEKYDEDYIGYEYWLAMVKGYGYDEKIEKDSPVIFVVNKIDEEQKLINQKEIAKVFPNAKKFHEISAATYEGVNELKQDIRKSIKNISPDVFTDKYSKTWIDIKKELENYSKEHINLTEYLDEICKDKLNENEAMAWLRILDRIGTVIYFGDHDGLKNWIILKPIWIKKAISGVIDYALAHYGVVREKDLPEIWKDYNEDDRENFKILLRKYKMASAPRKNDYGDTIYVIPSALPKQKPNLRKELEARPDYQIRFKYAPFIPAGTVSKLTVGLFDWVYEQKYYWKKNVVLHFDYQDFAWVSEDWDNKTVNVSFYGKNPQILFQQIIAELEKNNDDLKRARQIISLDFEIEAYYDGDWISKKNIEKFGIGDYQFLLGADHSGRKGIIVSNENLAESSNYINTQLAEEGVFWEKSKGELNILFVGANPPGTDELDLDGEYGKISSVLNELNIRAFSIGRANFDELKKGIDNYNPTILHISGHGIGNEKERQMLDGFFPELKVVTTGILFFSEDKMQSEIITAFDLAELIQAKKEYSLGSIRLVILNNCSSDSLAREVSTVGVYVIGIKNSIKDKIAIDFSKYLYSSINSKEKLNATTIKKIMQETVSSMPKSSRDNIILYYNGEEISLK